MSDRINILLVEDYELDREMTGDLVAVKALALRPDIPIILCTGYSEQINDLKAKKIGVKKFLMKPLLIEPLSAIIREVFK